MKKRLLAIVMTMAMALSLLPVTALADGADIGSQPAGQVQEDPDLGNTGGGGDDPLPGDGPNEGDDPSLPEDEDPSLPPPNNTIPMVCSPEGREMTAFSEEDTAFRASERES